MILGMVKEKVTITVDRAKLTRARDLTGARSASEAVDIALEAVLRREQLRRDIAAYTGRPPTEDELALAGLPVDWSDLADDTDWDSLYGKGR